ncbi:unnamed protein product [Callosobruchus maculatus]|uniref:Protein sleepless n=1 Tax=Callosobruchus maculatus TaxID=64391 RepID=A0A653D5Q7_CALMS|nr:unnamed protein product [Callosobruchus maculatus]
MGFCKIVLLLTFAIMAIVTVSCIKCYMCNTNNRGCAELQDPKSSRTDNCISITNDEVCIQYSFVRRGKPRITRDCILAGFTCDDVRNELRLIHAELRNCTICNDNLCNGNDD